LFAENRLEDTKNYEGCEGCRKNGVGKRVSRVNMLDLFTIGGMGTKSLPHSDLKGSLIEWLGKENVSNSLVSRVKRQVELAIKLTELRTYL